MHLIKTLGEYSLCDAARFHMPGHKGLPLDEPPTNSLASWDITELSFSGDLYSSTGIVYSSQAQTAKLFGAAHTFYLVNGSTAGIHAMLLSMPRGSKIIMGRDCHRSAINGAALFGLDAYFLSPEYDKQKNIWGVVKEDALRQAFIDSKANAALITSPNYYGLCADIPALKRVADEFNAKLFVDAAHGSHFPFSKLLPNSPAGIADMWVHSAHKTLNALGQSAFLNIASMDDYSTVLRSLSMLQTSSPSYLLLASLEHAANSAAKEGAWDMAVNRCINTKNKIKKLSGLEVLELDSVKHIGAIDKDETRLVIDVTGRGQTGFDAAALLEQQNIFIEMADDNRLVLICTPADKTQWYERLLNALNDLPYGNRVFTPCRNFEYNAVSEMTLAAAARSPLEYVKITDSVGRIAASPFGLYPPGIPLFLPGERITPAGLNYMLEYKRIGASFFGVMDDSVAVVS